MPSTFGCAYGNFHQLGTVRLANDAPYLDGLQRQLNQTVADAAGENRATYIDTYASSGGHGVCAHGSNRWMYGVFSDLVLPAGGPGPVLLAGGAFGVAGAGHGPGRAVWVGPGSGRAQRGRRTRRRLPREASSPTRRSGAGGADRTDGGPVVPAAAPARAV
ncbi:hypothetical protein ACGFZP_31835 [Kitasatospora sp. NPDC048239]|uniref:hypothetical protein n=1 Tax=Kitasatospora sp. NPDC048239 TaxID=3364046 RepID=UPI003719DCF1